MLSSRATLASRALAGNESLVGLADECLVNCDCLAFIDRRLGIMLGHRLANTVSREPSRPVGTDGKQPHQPMGRVALLARRRHARRRAVPWISGMEFRTTETP